MMPYGLYLLFCKRIIKERACSLMRNGLARIALCVENLHDQALRICLCANELDA